MRSAATQFRSEYSGFTPAREIFSEHREGLEWLANFIAGDERVATACVIDACAITESQNPTFEKWPVKWARMATIRSAVDVHRSRLAQLSQEYARRPCLHGGHSALLPESLELAIEKSSLLIRKLDVLCRCALVLCGIEKYSIEEAAHLLGIDYTSVQGAYCAALEVLDVIGCEQFREENHFAAVCN